MIVKTITCHKVYNHGASLQEYALLKHLNSNGYKAETIDYTPYYLSNHHNFLDVSNPKFEKNFILKILYLLAKLPGRIKKLKRKKAFDTWEDKYIPTGKVNYTNVEELKENTPVADVYICGSDQIWNSFFQNGKDPSFYLAFVPDDKLKISYAASFAIDTLEPSHKVFVKEKVQRIDHISVREKSGVSILEDLDISNVHHVMDPVFLLGKNHWVKEFVNEILDEKFIFVYDCDSNPSIERIVKEAASKQNLKIYTVNDNVHYADKNFFYEGPSQFLSLIYSAQYVISNSFHAVAFSLIFNKKFFVVDRSEQINTRMRDIMKMVGLSHLHLTIDEYKSLSDISIDYTVVNENVSLATRRSKEFLKNALKVD